MNEHIMKIEQDIDGIEYYIKKGELIRCKDCVYWSSKKTRYCNMLKGTFQENDYCSYAERRTDE